jgi:thymidylate synthase
MQIGREPRALPVMRLDAAVHELEDFRFEHFSLEQYDPHPAIKAPISI